MLFLVRNVSTYSHPSQFKRSLLDHLGFKRKTFRFFSCATFNYEETWLTYLTLYHKWILKLARSHNFLTDILKYLYGCRHRIMENIVLTELKFYFNSTTVCYRVGFNMTYRSVFKLNHIHLFLFGLYSRRTNWTKRILWTETVMLVYDFSEWFLGIFMKLNLIYAPGDLFSCRPLLFWLQIYQCLTQHGPHQPK